MKHHGSREKPACSRRALLTVATTALLVKGLGLGKPALAETLVTSERPIIQPEIADDLAFIQRAFDMRQRAVDLGDQPYGAVIVRDGIVIGQSWSRVVLDGDPTQHAEMAAIRDAAQRSGSRDLSGAVMYSSSRPCPMCEAAAYWADIEEMIHGRAVHRAGRPALCG